MKDEDLTAPQLWRRHRLRQVLLFVTIPGLIMGVGGLTAAYSSGLMTPAPPKAACQPTIVPAPKRASFTVNVMNATGKDGVASDVAAGLAKRKFTIGGISNAPDSWYVTPSAVIHYGPKGLDQALLVQSEITGSKLFEDSRGSTSVDVVVGLGYTRDKLVAIPPRLKPIPREVTVNVYNTTYKTGLAKTVADEVRARGFKVKEVANDPLRTMQMGTAVIRYGEQGDLAAALLKGHVPGAQLVRDNRAGASVDLVIGNAFTELVPLSQVPPLPPRPTQEVPTVARPCSG